MTLLEGAKLRITAQFTNGAGSKALNVYHAELISPTPADDEDVVACALDYVEAIMAELTTDCTSTYELEQVELYELIGEDWGPVGVASGTWVGTAGGELLPPGTALLVNAFKSRSGYSDKKYFGGLSELVQSAGVFIATTLENGEAAGDVWVAQFTDGTVTILPKSYNRSTGLLRAYNGTVTVNEVVSYQRRRRQGVGLT